jgi:exodeoxyribonuclease V gamma subunit
MLNIQFSNRLETLREGLLAGIGEVPSSPFSAQQIVVPSSAMRRHLTLAIADRHGICANVECVYLAQWLWRQIARVVRTVTVESPFAADVLVWRIYRLLEDAAWTQPFARLANYLRDPSPGMRFDLATEVASLFEQYITYRQDWMGAWQRGEPIVMPQASAAQVEDQHWQAELWRRIGVQMGADQEHPATRFFRCLETSSAAGANPFDLPQAVHVFCLPAMPPLYLAVLTGLARWVDVTLYVLNPCREYWFDIVDPKRLRALAVRGRAAHYDTGNRLLASWGGQTKAYIELLLDRTGDAPVDDGGFDDRFPATALGQLQYAISTLTELAPASLRSEWPDRSIEVHVCHSLTRQIEVLQDQLLALFAGPSPPRPDDILIVMPDLEAAAPLIEAVFGNVPDERRLPYAVTGRSRSSINAPARALIALLDILPSRFPASALIELLQQPLIGRRFHLAAEDLEAVQEWIQDSGIRWGIDAAHRREFELPDTQRFTLEDGLDRLFLGYALPDRVSLPAFGRIPAGNAEGSRAATLGLFARFAAELTALRAALREPRLPHQWLEALSEVVDGFLAPDSEDIDDLGELRATLGELEANMRRGGLATPLPLAVVRLALQALLDDPARGGVPTGSITFSSMSSLRNLPFRFIGVIGLDEGAFPSAARPREFDLMAAAPRPGDRQRRVDDRNLFLDLLLATRERLYLSYTGRSIRDNGVLPPSVVVAELIETLLPALAAAPGDTAALAAARCTLVIEHPLQAFAERYFRADGDPRLRSFNRELCEALRHSQAEPAPEIAEAVASELAPMAPLDAPLDATAGVDPDPDDDATLSPRATRFFPTPLIAPGPEWRQVSLEQLLQFYRNPCHFLLRRRLGMSLYREEEAASDDEPFLPDFLSRQALAERLLPQAIQGIGAQDLRRLAEAGIEYPPGTLGNALLNDEMGSLQRFAVSVRDATQTPPLPPLSVDLSFAMDGEDWRLATALTGRRAGGLVLHRYDDTRATDYLAAWLTHLVAAAASPQPTQTRWISRDGSFVLNHSSGARDILQGLMALYRRGLREPIHFFPKSAWEYVHRGRDLARARRVWHSDYGPVPGEETHAAYRLALRGIKNPLDADFQACAETVFGLIGAHLDDERL